MKSPAVYILASKPYGTLYTGFTTDLYDRMAQHTQGLFEGYTKRYGVKALVYYEHHHLIDEAIAREKRLKDWLRPWKYRIIEQMNPTWKNLYDPATGEIADGPADVQLLDDERRFGR